MPNLTTPALTWLAQTRAVNLMKPPARFLMDLLGPEEETLATEQIEIATYTSERDVAPFVRKHAEAEMVGGVGESVRFVEGPNIRIKRPWRPSSLLTGRTTGTPLFPTANQVISDVNRKIARDLQNMNFMIDNAEEWMLAMALRGAITYSVADREVFTITIPRAAGFSITPSVFWNDATPANITAVANLRAIFAAVAEVSGGVTDAIMGSEVAAAFYKLPELLATINLNSGFIAGNIDLTTRYRADGAIYVGSWMGIRWWEYPRTVRIEGVATALIRPKWIEFVSRDTSKFDAFYAAIPDMDAMESGSAMQVKRFSKTWKQPDPSAKIALIHSRPLIYPRNPDATVSFKAISG